MSAPFTARYHGECSDCQGRIAPGDEVVYVDGEVEHVSCSGGAPSSRDEKREPCPACWTVPAKNGACACDPA